MSRAKNRGIQLHHEIESALEEAKNKRGSRKSARRGENAVNVEKRCAARIT